MTQQLHCPLCGSDKVNPGKLQADAPVSFPPDAAKFLKTDAANIEMTGLLCTHCGNVTLLGETARPDKAPEDPAAG